MIDDAVLLNAKTYHEGGYVKTEHHDSYSESYEVPATSTVWAEIAFMHNGKPLMVFPRTEDADLVATLFRAAKSDAIERPNIPKEKEAEKEEEKKPIPYVTCPHCSTINLPVATCSMCGKPLQTVL
jgi:hypothetical protein